MVNTKFRYIDPLITAPAVEGVAQATIHRAIPATGSLAPWPQIAALQSDSIQASDWRVEELVDAILAKSWSDWCFLGSVDLANVRHKC